MTINKIHLSSHHQFYLSCKVYIFFRYKFQKRNRNNRRNVTIYFSAASYLTLHLGRCRDLTDNENDFNISLMLGKFGFRVISSKMCSGRAAGGKETSLKQGKLD